MSRTRQAPPESGKLDDDADSPPRPAVMTQLRNLPTIVASIVLAIAAAAAQAEPLLHAIWTGSGGASVFTPGTPDHPGHTDVDADGGGFHRLERVADGASVIRTQLDVTQRQTRWLQIRYEIRGQNAHGIAGLGYRIRGADAQTDLDSGFDYPPCPKRPDNWTACTMYVRIAAGARTLDVFLAASFSSSLDVRAVDVETAAPESVQPASATTAADMNRLFDWVRTRYFLTDQVDWTRARSRCDAGTFPRDFDPTVPFARCLLRELPQNAHSYVGRKPAARPVPFHAVKQLESGIGYAKPAPAAVGPGAESDAYAASASRAIATLQAQGVSNWIVDLRGNGGGNVYPMLAAVAPLIGPQRKPLVYWEHAGGRKTPVGLTARGAEEGGKVQVAVSGLKPPTPRTRIVVFVDRVV